MSEFVAKPLAIKAVFVQGVGNIGELRQGELTPAEWQDLRSRINHAVDRHIAVCQACLEPVVVHARTNGSRRPHFKHRASDGAYCPWRTEQTQPIDRVRASIFRGLQEGHIHEEMCLLISALIEQDPRLVPGSSSIDTYVRPAGEGHGRWPDVQFELSGLGRFAIEVQFAPSLAPEVVGRSDFYLREGMHLIWIVPRFDFEVTKRAFAEDIAYEGQGTAFCMDDEACARSRERRTLVFRALWRQDGEVRDSLVALDELNFPVQGHPFFVDTVSKGIFDSARHERERILTLLRSTKGDIDNLVPLQDSAPVPDYYAKRFLCVVFSTWLQALGQFENLLNNQKTITGLLDAYLNSSDGKPYADFLDSFLRRTRAGRDARPAVWQKIERARHDPQRGLEDQWYSFATGLFPEVFREDLRARTVPPEWALAER